MTRDAGTDAAFTEFAIASRARLRSTAYLLCGDWDRASDHVQEALIRVYVVWPRLVRHSREITSAREAVVNVFLDASRKCSSREQPLARPPTCRRVKTWHRREGLAARPRRRQVESR